MPRKIESSNILKDNWYLILAVVVLLVGGVVAAVMSGGEEEELPTGVVGSAGDGVDIIRVSDDDLEDKPTVGYQDLTAEERDAKYVEEYTQKLQEDPNGAHAPETMIALATVYRRQGNFDDAAIVMEDLVEKYPDNPHARTARIQLPEVYQDAGDVSMARASYQRMMEFFPPDTQEHQWAQQRYNEL